MNATFKVLCYNSKTVEALFHEYIKLLENENRIGYALSVKQVYRSLIKYTGSLDFYFSEITVKWLRDYEAWLRSNQIADNTIGIRLWLKLKQYGLILTESGFGRMQVRPSAAPWRHFLH